MTAIEIGIVAEVALLLIMLLSSVALVCRVPKDGAENTVDSATANKEAIVFSFVFALLCLWAGLLAPIYGASESLLDKLLIIYIPDALNKFLGWQLFSGEWVKVFSEFYLYSVFGYEINLLALFLVLYAALAVVGLLLLVPIIFHNKHHKTGFVMAATYEILSALVLVAYVMLAGVGGGTAWANYGVLVALFGVLLALEVQCVIAKEGLGAYKVFAFTLSGLSMVALFDLTGFLDMFWEPLSALATKTHSSVGFIGEELGFSYFALYVLNFNSIGSLLAALDLHEKFVAVSVIATTIIVTFNLIYDIIGLGTGSRFDRDGKIKIHFGSKLRGLVRYFIQLLCVVLSIGMVIAAKDIPGLYLYLLLIFSTIQFLAAVVRFVVAEKQEAAIHAAERRAAYKKRVDESFNDVFDPSEGLIDFGNPVVEVEYKPRPVTQPVVENKDEPIIKLEKYEPVYDGPRDSFIDTLDTNQKFEFKTVFLDKKGGDVSAVGDYEVGGDNTDFFEEFFIHLSTVQKNVSDGLVDKAYRKVVGLKA